MDIAQLISENRDRLKRMIRLRLNPRVAGRIDESDVIQEACVEATRRQQEYLANSEVSPFVWLRFITEQKLVELHRKHLGVKARDAQVEVRFRNGTPGSPATSCILAEGLAARDPSPSEMNMAREGVEQLTWALDQLPEADREMLALRHFEQLSNQEAAELLGLSSEASYKRYIRALQKLRQLLAKGNATDE